MKKYLYKGDSTLSFTHDGVDYQVYGNGPHLLPESATPVISAVGLSLLIAIQQNDLTSINTQKIKQDGK